MEKKYVKIFKCRGCNRDIIKNDVDLSIAEKWTLSGMFEDGCKPVEMSSGSRLSGQNKFLLHRCDFVLFCFCVFFGWFNFVAKISTSSVQSREAWYW